MQGQQLELELFFPLTEQIPLDLDYTPCNLTFKSYNSSLLLHNGALTTSSSTIYSNFEIKSSNTNAGYYTFGTSNLRIFLEKKPSALTRWAMDKVFNMKWFDK